MKHIDLNCDMGEGMPNDEALMPLVNSANIACGLHAGDADTIRRTIELALRYRVRIGAHPSFPDRENFGRSDMQLAPAELRDLLIEQLARIDEAARALGTTLCHVKPHGALYNTAARDASVARLIAQAVKEFRQDLVLYGLSGSFLVSEAKAMGLNTANEVFADRSYTDEGRLTPRNEPGALIEDEAASLRQVAQMLGGSVTTRSGKTIPIEADTICIHGDGSKAVQHAQAIHHYLQTQGLADTPA